MFRSRPTVPGRNPRRGPRANDYSFPLLLFYCSLAFSATMPGKFQAYGSVVMATVLRPLSTGELLDRTFSLYRSHFGLFVGIFALPNLCVLAFQCLGLALKAPPAQAFDISRMLLGAFWGLGALALTLVVTATSQAATVVAVSEVHLDRPAGVMDSFSKVKNQIAGVIGLSLSVGFLVGLACLALIVPGILLAIRWSLAIPVKVLEGRSVGDSMSRSTDLTQGNRGRIFVIWLLFLALSIGVSMLLQWPIKIAAGVGGILALQQAAPGWHVASLAATFISQCLVGPLATIAFSLVYYDERVRKEAFDLQLMMSTLDAPALQRAPA
jgi:Membrane domain of glycerophosphoryl diester phosphodiesterase